MTLALFAARCEDCIFVRYSTNPYLAGIKADHHADKHPGHIVHIYDELGQELIGKSGNFPVAESELPDY